jgi:hypothetical protein
MRNAGLVIPLTAVTLAFLSVRATAQTVLPDGPNSELVARACGACHDVSLVLGTGGQSRENWAASIENMTAFGMDIPLADRRLILEYLATYLPPR